MSVIQENDNSSQYKQLKFVEFLELIGRAAVFNDLRNGNEPDETSLVDKIKVVLDYMLRIVGSTRRDPIINVREESESDDDY